MFSVKRIVTNDKVLCGNCVIKTAEYAFAYVSEINAPLYLEGSSVDLCEDCFNELKKAANGIEEGGFR